ncbi:MAG TPA: HAMP domain-containing sensor histidine kinase [Spirochaetia bacterium]|nr:HAMP domain-containing sensor histidine kinase [Spirochaetales bacterium]HRY79167.1 HAMP domain-containing sensor histidine kinase [Spirochaetia bacterium]HRZ88130.1 HAMP domain-containing sensor histidine kinase [Spirochaetia bacterium]
MRIRTQFYLLAAGIVIIPLAVMTGFYFAWRLREAPAPRIPGYEEILNLAGEPVDRAAWEELARFMERKPPTVEYTVLDPSMRVLFSTIEDFGAGEAVPDAEVLDRVRGTGERYLYQLDSPVKTEGGRLLVLTRISREGRRPPSPFQRLFTTFATLLAALFAVSAAGSVLIARSLTQSVLALEAATRRIAAGELDAPVAVRGGGELASLAASLVSMRDALKEDRTRRSRFIMGVSHDLKTPLALIKGYAEAIGDGMADAPGERERCVEIIGAKVDQLDGMVDDLIDFVRMDTAEWRRHLRSVELAPFLRDLVRRTRADAELLGRRVQDEVELPEGISAPMDERLAQRALENILNNALRYTGPGGLVRLAARAEPGRAVVTISDDGPGIPGEDLPRIFDLFYRGTASRREQGLGLGLAVVRGVADSHGWEIRVRSEPGRGSEFEISIPLSARPGSGTARRLSGLPI